MVQKLHRLGINLKRLVEEGHVTFEEVTTIFGSKKANGYIFNSIYLAPKVKKQT